MDHEGLLRDLQVLVVLLGLVAHLGLRAFLDLLGQKVNQVLQVLQVLTVRLVPKGLLDFLGHLVNRLSLFRRYQVYQDPVEIQAPRALDTQAPQEPSAQQELDQQDLVELPAPVASMDWQDLSDLPALLAKVQRDPLEVLDQLDQVLTLDLSGRSVLSGLPALQDLSAKGLSGTQVLEEILAQPALVAILARPEPLGLEVPMGIV